MSREMLLNIQPDEERVAIIENGVLKNLEIETSATQTLKGNIYKGVIRKVEPALQACFVDYGTTKNGFLPRSEIHSQLYPEGVSGSPLIQEIFKEGQEVMVQVVRDAIGQKGVTFSTYITLAGRFMVLVPDTDRVAVSRKMDVKERRRFREIAEDLKVPPGYGVIIRTAAEGKPKDQIHADLDYLRRLYQAVQERYDSKKGVGIVYKEAGLGLRFVRDYLSTDVDSVHVDDEDAHDQLQVFMTHVMPDSLEKLRLYRGEKPLFFHFNIEDKVEESFLRTVPLPSGGAIVIDQAEALVAIDVNSGRTKGQNIEETAFQTNLEACRAIAQQMLIRDFGGLVVIDFIDMRDSAKRREIERELRRAMADDKAHYRLGRISQFGLLELTRQRLRSTALQTTFSSCTTCNGRGLVRSTPSASMKVLRHIHDAAAGKRANVIRANVSVEVANFLLNRRRKFLASLEETFRCHIDVLADPSQALTEVTLDYISLPSEELPVDKPIHRTEKVNMAYEQFQTAGFDAGVDAEASDAEPTTQQETGSWFSRLFSRSPSSTEAKVSVPDKGSRLDLLEGIDEVEDLGVSPQQEKLKASDKPVSSRSGGRSSNRGRKPRARRKPKPQVVVGGSMELVTAGTASTPTSEKKAASNSSKGSEATADGPPKRRRRRRRRSSSSAGNSEAAAATTAEGTTQDSSESKSKTSKPSPRKPRRTSKASKSSESVEAGAAKPDKAESTAGSEEKGDTQKADAPKKPRSRSSRSRRPRATADSNANGAAAKSEPPPVPAKSESKPKKSDDTASSPTKDSGGSKWAPVIDLRK
ncbi:MAG: hypothetical protein CMH54_11395 [Myxococcales bacterium]|nr:hypothetical protein [Myxococcales bacterium]